MKHPKTTIEYDEDAKRWVCRLDGEIIDGDEDLEEMILTYPNAEVIRET